MPKRKDLEAGSARVESVPCVFIGQNGAPLPIPTMHEGGHVCVPLNTTDAFLNKVAGERVRGEVFLVVRDFMEDLYQAIQAAGIAAIGAPLLAVKDAGASSAGAPKARAVMGLDNDSSDDEFFEKRPQAVKQFCKQAKVFRQVMCRGMELTVKARNKSRGICVPLAGDTLATILNYLREQVVKGAVPEPDAPKAARRVRAALAKGCRAAADEGRVRWSHPDCGYEIKFKDELGKVHRVSKGLKPRRRNAIGEAVDACVFKAERNRLMLTARVMWNEFDKSGATRYPVCNLP